MANTTYHSTLPPLPSYTLTPVKPLIPGIDDGYLALAAPVAAYWIVSLFFHCLDTLDLFPQYRLHTPAEVLKRNHVTRWDVFRDVIIQQVIQTAVGMVLAMIDEPNMTGKEEYDIARWAQLIRLGQQALPKLLAVVGVDALSLSKNLGHAQFGVLSNALAGGVYPALHQTILLHGQPTEVPAFAQWELTVAQAIYYLGVPALQFLGAILVVDTWQYWLHRAMHMNKWLYTTFHSRHHRLYVPYAYGALYNHPFEGFLLDTLGACIAYLITGMTVRQSMWFFTISTIKTVDDHCGYAFPWDPIQHLTSNNAGYHDVHHQSWGVKTNFSQPFFTFWDTLLGTKWNGGDVSVRYERAKKAAQDKVDAERRAAITNSSPADASTNAPNPYASDVQQSSSAARTMDTVLEPRARNGKAVQQSIASRQQVIDADGLEPLIQESIEEIQSRKALSA